jgi:hypothetical protein
MKVEGVSRSRICPSNSQGGIRLASARPHITTDTNWPKISPPKIVRAPLASAPTHGQAPATALSTLFLTGLRVVTSRGWL